MRSEITQFYTINVIKRFWNRLQAFKDFSKILRNVEKFKPFLTAITKKTMSLILSILLGKTKWSHTLKIHFSDRMLAVSHCLTLVWKGKRSFLLIFVHLSIWGRGEREVILPLLIFGFAIKKEMTEHSRWKAQRGSWGWRIICCWRLWWRDICLWISVYSKEKLECKVPANVRTSRVYVLDTVK